MRLYNLKTFILGLTALMLFGTSCELDDIPDPNNPTLEALTNGGTAEDISLMATGLEASLRSDLEFYYWTVSIVGREYYDLRGTDPRYTGELMGAEGAILDNNGFLTTRTFGGRYRAIRNANNFLDALDNTSASFTPEQINAYRGLAIAAKAYQLMLVFNHQYQNGSRIDVADTDNLGPIVSYEEGMRFVVNQFDEAAGLLNNGGDAFASASTLADSPAGLAQFAKAMSARASLYLGDKGAALASLQGSYFDLEGDLNTGTYLQFGAGGNDTRNPLFNVLNTTPYVVTADFLANAEEGDTRIDDKTTPFVETEDLTLPISLAGLEGDVQVTLYDSDVASIPIIRNEELILIYAEANIGTNNDETVAALNIIRNAAGLDDYSGDTDDASLLDAVLQERRYSLFGEGHRWIDLRRTGKLGEIVVDRPGDVVHTQFPLPVLEMP